MRVGRVDRGRGRFHAAVIAAVAAVSLPLFAGVSLAAQPEPKHAVVQQLLERSGTNDVIRNFLAGVRNEMKLRASELAGAEAPFVERTFEVAFEEAAMCEQVARHLLDRYDDAHARETLAWFESEFGEKVRAEEAYALSPQAEMPMREYIAALEHETPNPDRVALAAAIDQARASSTLNHELLFEFMRGLTLVTTAATEAFGSMPSEAEIDASWREQLEPLATTMAEQMIIFYGFMGRNLSVADQRAYLAHLESDAGQWFYREVSVGLTQAIGRAGRAFGHRAAARLTAVRAEAEVSGMAPTDAFEAERTAAVSEARSFAAARSSADCVEAVYERRRACGDAMCVVLIPDFASTCFAAAKQGRARCKGVPDPLDTVATLFWRAETCVEQGRSDPACNAALGELQQTCSSN